MKRFLKLIPITAFVMLMSCKQFPNPFADNKVLAEVGNESLYLHDVTSVFTEDMTAEDSVKLLQLYVDQWVKKQLKVKEGELIFASSQDDIDQMVEEYRNSLLTFKVDQHYVDRQVDTLFTDQQISDYYDEHKADFILDKTILKGIVVKVPESYRQAAKLKDLMGSARMEDYQDFADICAKNGFELTELTTWTDMPALLALLPTDKEKNYDYLATEGKVHEFKNKDFYYFVKISNHRSAGDCSPLESVADIVKRVIFNQRKQEIIKTHEDSLYQSALMNKEIVVHVN